MTLSKLIEKLEQFPFGCTISTVRCDYSDNLAIYDSNGNMIEEIDLDEEPSESEQGLIPIPNGYAEQ